MNEIGLGIPRDVTKAIEFYKKAPRKISSPPKPGSVNYISTAIW